MLQPRPGRPARVQDGEDDQRAAPLAWRDLLRHDARHPRLDDILRSRAARAVQEDDRRVRCRPRLRPRAAAASGVPSPRGHALLCAAIISADRRIFTDPAVHLSRHVRQHRAAPLQRGRRAHRDTAAAPATRACSPSATPPRAALWALLCPAATPLFAQGEWRAEPCHSWRRRGAAGGYTPEHDASSAQPSLQCRPCGTARLHVPALERCGRREGERLRCWARSMVREPRAASQPVARTRIAHRLPSTWQAPTHAAISELAHRPHGELAHQRALILRARAVVFALAGAVLWCSPTA